MLDGHRRVGKLLLAGSLLAGCRSATPGIAPEPGIELAVTGVALQSETIELQLARPACLVHRTLLVFGTGDGGWRSADRQLFEALLRWGYPVAGFDARDYLAHLDAAAEPATPDHVARDYERLIAAGRERLRLPPDAPVVLLGFSRGAGLAIAAATRPELRGRLLGVVAVGLGEVEENVRRRERGSSAAEGRVLEPFIELSRFGATPVAVIQSTRDRYLAASEARKLFGPDSARRRLIPVESRGHTFGGAREELLRRVAESLDWIGSLASRSGGGAGPCNLEPGGAMAAR